MKVKLDSLYKIALFLILFLPVAISSAEINLALSLMLLVFVLLNVKFKYSYTLLSTLFPLITIIIIGCIIGFLFKPSLYNYIKDITVFLKPIFFIVLGYYFIGIIKDKDFAFKIIIYLAILFASIHLFKIFIYLLDYPFVVNKLRTIGGKANYIELFAFVILLMNKKNKYFEFSPKWRKFILLILMASIFFYFSRTMIVATFLMFFAIKGFFVITRKRLKYLMLLIGGVLLFYSILYSINLERGAEGMEGFLYKIKIAPTEIFATDIDKDSKHSELWDKWRGYEAYKALEQVYRTDLKFGVFFGKGFGSLIDLEFAAPLGGEEMQYIPQIHNGYVYILFKTGLLGLFFYLIFLLFTYLQAYSKTENPKSIFINNSISSIALFYVFSSIIITGIYNHGDVYALILGVLLYLKQYYKQLNISKE